MQPQRLYKCDRVFAGIGPAKLSEMRKMTYERIVHFGDSCEVSECDGHFLERKCSYLDFVTQI